MWGHEGLPEDVCARIPGPLILRCVVGSTVHGLNVQDGIEDRDEMAVCVESLAGAMGVTSPFEQVVYRTAAVREQKHDAKSRAGDLDLVVYSLRKYVRLALKGNPTILALLFAPTEECDSRGSQLRGLAPEIVSRQAGKAYLGYLIAQRQRLLGERGQKDVNRPELVAKYGFDTKYAMHLLRLGLQGIELMTTGRLTFPMPEPERSRLRAVRTGGESLQSVLTWAGALEKDLKDLLDLPGLSPLPEHPNAPAVETFMLDCYLEHWKCEAFDERLRPAWSDVRGVGPHYPSAVKGHCACGVKLVLGPNGGMRCATWVTDRLPTVSYAGPQSYAGPHYPMIGDRCACGEPMIEGPQGGMRCAKEEL